MLPSGSPLSAGTPTRLEMTSATPGYVGAAAANQDLIRLRAAAAGGQVELQGTADLLGHVVDEGIEHFRLIVARQAALLLGAAGLFHGEAVGAHDLLGELLSAEGEVAGINDSHVAQHAERGAARAEIHHGDGPIQPAVRHLMAHQRAGVLQREGFHVDEVGGQARGLDRRLALFDVFRAGRDQEHVQHVRVLLRRSHDLVVVADFFHGEGDVLVGLHFDLTLEFVLAEVLRHLNHFRDGGIAADRDGGEPALGAGALHRTPDRLADRFRVHDRLFVDGVMGRGFRRIGLNAILAARHRELNELHRRGGYVKSQKRTISFAERPHSYFPFSLSTLEVETGARD